MNTGIKGEKKFTVTKEQLRAMSAAVWYPYLPPR